MFLKPLFLMEKYFLSSFLRLIILGNYDVSESADS